VVRDSWSISAGCCARLGRSSATSWRSAFRQLQLSELDGGDGGFKQKLRLIAGGVSYPTKIEVSYHEETDPAEASVQIIPEPYQSRYRLPVPTKVAAYPAPTALWHKVLALSRRASPQTRDVFDVSHLQQQAGATATDAGFRLIRTRMRHEQVAAAADAVLAFTIAEFTSQTAAYLQDSLARRRHHRVARRPTPRLELVG
jgi:hypothetical protein